MSVKTRKCNLSLYRGTVELMKYIAQYSRLEQHNTFEYVYKTLNCTHLPCMLCTPFHKHSRKLGEGCLMSVHT